MLQRFNLISFHFLCLIAFTKEASMAIDVPFEAPEAFEAPGAPGAPGAPEASEAPGNNSSANPTRRKLDNCYYDDAGYCVNASGGLESGLPCLVYVGDVIKRGTCTNPLIGNCYCKTP